MTHFTHVSTFIALESVCLQPFIRCNILESNVREGLKSVCQQVILFLVHVVSLSLSAFKEMILVTVDFHGKTLLLDYKISTQILESNNAKYVEC